MGEGQQELVTFPRQGSGEQGCSYEATTFHERYSLEAPRLCVFAFHLPMWKTLFAYPTSLSHNRIPTLFTLNRLCKSHRGWDVGI
jgi:hypothetical protein